MPEQPEQSAYYRGVDATIDLLLKADQSLAEHKNLVTKATRIMLLLGGYIFILGASIGGVIINKISDKKGT